MRSLPDTLAYSALFRILVFLSAGLCNATPETLEASSGHDAGLSSAPLGLHSDRRASNRFTSLPKEETGISISNQYSDPEMWGNQYHEFDLGAIGTGVAVGDYDNDGLPDLFAVSKTETCRLFKNLGGFKFKDVTSEAGVEDIGKQAGIWKQGATFADVNNDGLLDIYVCRKGAPNLLYINQGDGRFLEQAKLYGLDVVDGSATPSFADFDRDGWLDLYLQTNLLDHTAHPEGQRDYLFHNNGNGTFSDVTVASGIGLHTTQGNSVSWWDYDNDGWPDLYVANDFALPDFLFHNNRDGTFTNVIDSVVPHCPYSSMGSDQGDINNDGLIDFFVADMAASTRVKDQRTMADTRSRNAESGRLESGIQCYLRNSVYLNTGTGRCEEIAYLSGLSATDWTWSVRLEDLDNDGRLDVHVTNGMHREIHNSDLLRKIMAQESSAERIRTVRQSPVFKEQHLAYRNLGNLMFEDVSKSWGLDQVGVGFGAGFGDFDGDGNLDIVYGNYQGDLTVLRNDLQTGNSVEVYLRGTESNRFGIGSTVKIQTDAGDQVRTLLLTRGYMSSSEPMVHFGLGQSTQLKRLEILWPSGVHQTFTDLAANRKYIVTETRLSNSRLTGATALRTQFVESTKSLNLALTATAETIDEQAQQPLLPFGRNQRGPSLCLTDLNGDGIDDVVFGGTTTSPVQILFGNGEKPFVAGGNLTPPNSSLNYGPILSLDADGDGRDDLLVTLCGTTQPAGSQDYQPKLFLNKSSGLFPAPPNSLPQLYSSISCAAAADFDHDGRLDVFLGAGTLPGSYPKSPHSALWRNRGGAFEDITDQMLPESGEIGMVTSAIWSDIDQDGWPDLLLTLEWGQVKCMHNEQGKGFADWTERCGFASAGTGLWTSIAAADFNEDGHMDYVVGNLGSNTEYRADRKHPLIAYYGEFEGQDTSQLIETIYDGDKCYPRRSRRDLTKVFPSLLRRFPKNDSYARSTLEAVFKPEDLAAAKRFLVTELRSGVLLSQADGSYAFQPLPVEAQIAPLQGLAAGDFDGDGFADIYAVQNFFSTLGVVDRFDGGLSQLLRGDGHGSFASTTVGSSGLVVDGDGKALAVADLNRDGAPDFLVSRSGQSALAFLNHPAPNIRYLNVRLHGAGANTRGIGSYITLQFRGTKRISQELYAGGGYMSQSSNVLFFGYPAGLTPSDLIIKWPDGAVSNIPLSGDNATVIEVTEK